MTRVFFEDDDVENLYHVRNIPSKVSLVEAQLEDSKFAQVTLFGKPDLIRIEGGYSWQNDVVAASFYMLTRWEEAIITSRDEHGRFMAKDSLAFKNSFLDRPIVNEYVEIIYTILKSFGLDQERKLRKYKTVATHDVDRPYLWSSKLGKLKSIGASLLLRRSKEEIKSRTNSLVAKSDPFDTFDELMDMSESIAQKAHFFFMAGGESEFDGYYSLEDTMVTTLIEKIKNRNHCIGIHPSYNTVQDPKLLNYEISKLKEVAGVEIHSSRQHYLRFDVTSTWNNLEENNVLWDSTMCYADACGFRSGVCYTYPVYDVKSRKQLRLLEKPLIVMDTTLLVYEKLKVKEALSKVEKLQKEVSRYGGDFVFLWHNSSFNSQEWIGYEDVFRSMYKQF